MFVRFLKFYLCQVIFTALNDIGLNDFLLSTAYIKEIKEIVVSRRGRGGGGGGGKRP